MKTCFSLGFSHWFCLKSTEKENPRFRTDHYNKNIKWMPLKIREVEACAFSHKAEKAKMEGITSCLFKPRRSFLCIFTLKVLGLAQKFCTCFCLKKYAVGFCFLQLRPISRLKCTANWYQQESLFSLPCQEDCSEAEPQAQSKVNRGNLRLWKR